MNSLNEIFSQARMFPLAVMHTPSPRQGEFRRGADVTIFSNASENS